MTYKVELYGRVNEATLRGYLNNAIGRPEHVSDSQIIHRHNGTRAIVTKEPNDSFDVVLRSNSGSTFRDITDCLTGFGFEVKSRTQA